MGNVTVNAPKTPVTEGSSGIAAATMPNVCKMPGPPAPFVPTPLPNIGKSGSSPKDYSKKVTIEGKAVAIAGASFGSMGDVASKGLGGGLVSMNCEGPTKFVGPGSMNTQIEGKNVQLLGDPMLNNCGPSGSPPNSATMTGVVQGPGGILVLYGDDAPCQKCNKTHPGIPADQAIKDDLKKLFDGLKRELAGQRGDIARLSRLRRAGNQTGAADVLQASLSGRAVLHYSKDTKTFSRGYMMGVLICKCGGKKLAAASGKAATPGFAKVVNASGFTLCTAAGRTPAQEEPDVSNWECAGRHLFEKIGSHEPAQMCERWFSPHIQGVISYAETPRVSIPYLLVNPGLPKKIVTHAFKYGQTVPSCTKCQKNLPKKVCNNKCTG
jgi:hypothetical protein